MCILIEYIQRCEKLTMQFTVSVLTTLCYIKTNLNFIMIFVITTLRCCDGYLNTIDKMFYTLLVFVDYKKLLTQYAIKLF